MNASHPTGLGSPQPFGKHSLFQPPSTDEQPDNNKVVKPVPEMWSNPVREESREEQADPPKLRTTITLSREAFRIVQKVQESHRLNTGRMLPVWKIISKAIEDYGKKAKL